MLRASNQNGFSLLGLLVAAGMAVVVLMGVVGLTARVMGTGTDARNNFIATALAREGIELVRSLRDDNYLNYEPQELQDVQQTIYWRGIESGSVSQPGVLDGELIRAKVCDGTYIIDPVIDGGYPSLIDFAGSSSLYQDANNMYVHDQAGTETPFSRIITIETDGLVGGCNIPSETNEPQPSPITVTSIVTWENRDGTPREISLTQKLYAIIRWR